MVSDDLNFGHLCALEPRLALLLLEALSHHPRNPGYSSIDVWYGCFRKGHRGLKNKMSRLVGWGAEQTGLLRTMEAYDVAYAVLYEALPDDFPTIP